MEPLTWRFVAADDRDPLPIEDGSIDLLISLYAGPVSDHCLQYPRPGGVLLANANHGDASLAALREDLTLVADVTSRGGDYRVRRDGLDRYLVPRNPDAAITRPSSVRRCGCLRARCGGCLGSSTSPAGA